jgi:hypothetical protein
MEPPPLRPLNIHELFLKKGIYNALIDSYQNTLLIPVLEEESKKLLLPKNKKLYESIRLMDFKQLLITRQPYIPREFPFDNTLDVTKTPNIFYNLYQSTDMKLTCYNCIDRLSIPKHYDKKNDKMFLYNITNAFMFICQEIILAIQYEAWKDINQKTDFLMETFCKLFLLLYMCSYGDFKMIQFNILFQFIVDKLVFLSTILSNETLEVKEDNIYNRYFLDIAVFMLRNDEFDRLNNIFIDFKIKNDTPYVKENQMIYITQYNKDKLFRFFEIKYDALSVKEDKVLRNYMNMIRYNAVTEFNIPIHLIMHCQHILSYEDYFKNITEYIQLQIKNKTLKEHTSKKIHNGEVMFLYTNDDGKQKLHSTNDIRLILYNGQVVKQRVVDIMLRYVLYWDPLIKFYQHHRHDSRVLETYLIGRLKYLFTEYISSNNKNYFIMIYELFGCLHLLSHPQYITIQVVIIMMINQLKCYMNNETSKTFDIFKFFGSDVNLFGLYLLRYKYIDYHNEKHNMEIDEEEVKKVKLFQYGSIAYYDPNHKERSAINIYGPDSLYKIMLTIINDIKKEYSSPPPPLPSSPLPSSSLVGSFLV